MSGNVTRRSFLRIAGWGTLSTMTVGAAGLLRSQSFARETGSPVVKSNCPLCPQGCGIDLFIEGGRLSTVRGMVEDPETRGMLCALGKSLPEIISSEKRVVTPLKRVGQKGAGAFAPITWNEALSTVAGQWAGIMREEGPQAIAGYAGMGLSMESSFLLPRLLYALGSPNVFLPEGLDEGAWGWAGRLTVGSFPTVSFDPWDRTGCMVLWGHNPDDASPCTTPRWIRDRKRKKGRLIVVNPRKIALAEEADEWVPIRPGTDGALAWSIAQVLMRENLHDAAFVEKWTEGFAGYREIALRDEYRPERVAATCGIEAEQITRIARLYAASAPSHILGGSGISQQGSGLQTCRAIHCLAALTGNINRPGSNLYYSYPLEPATGMASLEERVEGTGLLDKQLVKLPLGYSDASRLWDLILAEGGDLYWKDYIFRNALSEGRAPFTHTRVYGTGYRGKAYPVKSLLVLESDPLRELPHSLKGKMALTKLPLLVVITPFINETARHADIILPSAISPEATNLVSCHRPLGRHYLRVRKAAIAPRGESKSYQSIIAQLAYALGAGRHFAFTEMEYANMLFASSPFTRKFTHQKLTESPLPLVPLYTIRDLFPHPYRKSFDTPSGKVMFYSAPLHTMGFNPYPEWSPPLESRELTPEFFTRYPLLLATGRTLGRETAGENDCLLINPRDAQTAGLEDGMAVWVESKINKIKSNVKISTGIAQGVVGMYLETTPFGSGEGVARSEVNDLIDDRNNDPVCGAPRFNEMLVKVYRV